MMQRRTLLSLLPVPVLGACGFRLRQAPTFSFHTLYLSGPPASALLRELERTLKGAGGDVAVLRDPAPREQADVIFELLGERRQRLVVSLNASGQVRELQLLLIISYRLRAPDGVEWTPVTEMRQVRDVSYNESLALSKEAEEELLYKAMQTDLVQQILRRLAAARPPKD